MSKIVEYQYNETNDEVINSFIKKLDDDRFIRYAERVEYNVDVYSYVTIAISIPSINRALIGFPKRECIIDAILHLIGEEWNVYDGNHYTFIDAIDSLTDGANYTYFVYSYINSYLKGVLSDEDYMSFLDRVAQYRKYNGRPPLKPERGLSAKGYLPQG